MLTKESLRKKLWDLRQPESYWTAKAARRRERVALARACDPSFRPRKRPERLTPISLDEIREWLAARRS